MGNILRLAVVDPGKNTGVCLVEPCINSLMWRVRSGSPMEMVSEVHEWVRLRGRVAVVGERFTVTSVKHTRQYDALEVIGALRYVANRENHRFELQGRADRMRVDTAVAKRFATPKNDDEMSALKHAVVAAVRHGLLDPVNFYVTIGSRSSKE